MKVLSTLAIAGLLCSTAAFAASGGTAPAPATATKPAAAQPAPPARSAAEASGASHETAKEMAKQCREQAAAKKLKGKERHKFVKDCEAGKATS